MTRPDLAALRRNAEAATKEREPDPGQQWKCGDEFLPFHRSASHVPPDYRDGWNRCYGMAARRLVALLDELSALRAQPVAWMTKSGFYPSEDCIPPRDLPPLGNPVPLYAPPPAPSSARAHSKSEYKRRVAQGDESVMPPAPAPEGPQTGREGGEVNRG